MCAVIHYLLFLYKKLIFLQLFFLQNFSKIFSKTHHFKKFSRRSMPPNPPSKRVASPCKYPHFYKKILNPPPPPRNKILDTPLLVSYLVNILYHRDNNGNKLDLSALCVILAFICGICSKLNHCIVYCRIKSNQTKSFVLMIYRSISSRSPFELVLPQHNCGLHMFYRGEGGDGCLNVWVVILCKIRIHIYKQHAV